MFATRIAVLDHTIFKKKALQWAMQYDYFCLLDSHGYKDDPYRKYDWLLAIDAKAVITIKSSDTPDNAHQLLRDIHNKPFSNNWRFGFLSYELKNYFEQLSSNKHDGLQSDMACIFIPSIVIYSIDNTLYIEGNNCYAIVASIINVNWPMEEIALPKLKFNARIDKQAYLNKIHRIQDAIRNGDVYEMNLCQEFYTEYKGLNPLTLYAAMSENNPSPFAAFLRVKDQYILSLSPERYVKKIGSTLLSQPIKGTIKRGLSAAEDQLAKDRLYNDPKERAENTMIVDLVRNDLNRICLSGTVEVPEFLGIYSFPKVHHLQSTITGKLKENIHFSDVLKASFPMGSMTGAPKIAAMEIIEHYEETKRGIFSGSIGYMDTRDDYDWNVVIRTLIYDSGSGYLSYQSGGAITIDSTPEQEYEESLLKARSIQELFS